MTERMAMAATRAHESQRWHRRATRRAFGEFLALPTAVVAGYTVLAAVSVVIDKTSPHWLHPVLEPLAKLISKGAASTCCPRSPPAS